MSEPNLAQSDFLRWWPFQGPVGGSAVVHGWAQLWHHRLQSGGLPQSTVSVSSLRSSSLIFHPDDIYIIFSFLFWSSSPPGGQLKSAGWSETKTEGLEVSHSSSFQRWPSCISWTLATKITFLQFSIHFRWPFSNLALTLSPIGLMGKRWI